MCIHIDCYVIFKFYLSIGIILIASKSCFLVVFLANQIESCLSNLFVFRSKFLITTRISTTIERSFLLHKNIYFYCTKSKWFIAIKPEKLSFDLYYSRICSDNFITVSSKINVLPDDFDLMFSDMVLEDKIIVALPNPCEIVVKIIESDPSFQRVTYEPTFLEMLNSVPIYSRESSGDSPGTSKSLTQSSFILQPQIMNVPATVQSPLSLEIGVKLPIFSMECSKYLNGLVPCRKHTLKDVCSELAHHLDECLPEGNPSIRKRFYNRVTVLLKQSYPTCTFGEEGAGGVVKRVSNVIRKRRERRLKSLLEVKNANRMLNISGINDSSFDEDIQIMDEFERMGIVSKEAALERLLQVVEKLYPGSDILSALIRFHKNTTRKGVLCPIVIASSEDNVSSPGPQLILGEKITFVDKGKVIAIGHRHNDSLHVLQLIAYYYIMDLSYPRSFGGVLGLLQHYVLQIPFACTNKLWLKKCRVL
ncbi:uncharacterized protein LOC100209977 isoform X4 [Hydra vulgaris]|uniref:uncharacterized protein LOC100209977 isoform X4 n=1 Tax=Hydra vulgaris TaxID=6087 RepID=UPI0032EA1CCE